MTITLESLTGGEVTGGGLFDELMRTTKAHLQEELTSGRITNQNYATVYLGGLQANLQAAIQFLLEYEINNQKALLLQEQVKQETKRNELLNLQITKQQVDNDTAQYQLDSILPEQLATQVEQTKLVTQQIAQSTAEEELTDAKKVQVTTESAAKVLLLGKQEDLLNKQILTETANTTTPTAGLTKVQHDKMLKEIEVLNQKKVTELAQTEGTVSLDTNGKITAGGLLAHEMHLKQVQADSFKRDAEQKAAKVLTDTFAMVYATSPDNYKPTEWHLGGAAGQEVMNKLYAGINITPFAPVGTITPE